MFPRRRLVIVGVAAIVWYACILVFWAMQTLSDSVPVGVDNTLKTPASVSVSVECNTLFDSAPRDDSALPTLKVQPEGLPPLAFQREPCVYVQTQARIVFVFDTVLFLGVLGGLGWLVLRRRRIEEPRLGPEPSLVGSRAG
jgi:hypothetical protein